jgi:hypothetical protein
MNNVIDPNSRRAEQHGDSENLRANRGGTLAERLAKTRSQRSVRTGRG